MSASLRYTFRRHDSNAPVKPRHFWAQWAVGGSPPELTFSAPAAGHPRPSTSFQGPAQVCASGSVDGSGVYQDGYLRLVGTHLSLSDSPTSEPSATYALDEGAAVVLADLDASLVRVSLGGPAQTQDQAQTQAQDQAEPEPQPARSSSQETLWVKPYSVDEAKRWVRVLQAAKDSVATRVPVADILSVSRIDASDAGEVGEHIAVEVGRLVHVLVTVSKEQASAVLNTLNKLCSPGGSSGSGSGPVVDQEQLRVVDDALDAHLDTVIGVVERSGAAPLPSLHAALGLELEAVVEGLRTVIMGLESGAHRWASVSSSSAPELASAARLAHAIDELSRAEPVLTSRCYSSGPELVATLEFVRDHLGTWDKVADTVAVAVAATEAVAAGGAPASRGAATPPLRDFAEAIDDVRTTVLRRVAPHPPLHTALAAAMGAPSVTDAIIALDSAASALTVAALGAAFPSQASRADPSDPAGIAADLITTLESILSLCPPEEEF